MPDLTVLGIVQRTEREARVAFMAGTQAADETVLGATAPLPPTDVLRLSAACAERTCTHYDGEACRLASRIVSLLDPVVDALPACAIRKACRWYQQEGKSACLRCPQIVTSGAERDPQMARVATA